MDLITIKNKTLIASIQEIASLENRTPENMVETILLDHIKDYTG